jgi:two-component system, OmpR family, response regulator MprA
MRILVVEDDPDMSRFIARGLSEQSYAVDVAATGGAAIEAATTAAYDAIILDAMIPPPDGFEVCRHLRAEGIDATILMLTARDSLADRVEGLDSGADDYLVKPFDIDELKARLRALLRRAGGDGTTEGLTFEELTLDPSRHGVSVGEEFVELTRTEYQLLELLLLNPRRVLPHSLIYDRVWGYDFGPTSNALRVYIGYLRRKLEDAGSRSVIHTVRGVGYSLREPDA